MSAPSIRQRLQRRLLTQRRLEYCALSIFVTVTVVVAGHAITGHIWRWCAALSGVIDTVAQR